MSKIFNAVITAVALVSAPLAAHATATIVHVKLEDKTTGPKIKGMVMDADKTSVPAGKVTFMVTNESKALVHEMIVMHAALPVTKFPYNKATQRAIESKMHSMGEVSETRPGKSGTLTVNLKPGNYVLMCNQPGHLMSGMYEKFVVTK
ncbi:MAG: hypothetical protein KGQ37_06655 [Hyphomicrobiales bacterium]|nr:hypothetical protein [Hyphomicrobiales bacterium]